MRPTIVESPRKVINRFRENREFLDTRSVATANRPPGAASASRRRGLRCRSAALASACSRSPFGEGRRALEATTVVAGIDATVLTVLTVFVAAEVPEGYEHSQSAAGLIRLRRICTWLVLRM